MTGALSTCRPDWIGFVNGLPLALTKIIGQNHQVLVVNIARASMLAAWMLGHGRGGVVW